MAIACPLPSNPPFSPFQPTTVPHLPARRRYPCYPPRTEQRPASTLSTLSQSTGLSSRTRCPFCRQSVAFVQTPSLPMCSFCHRALAAFQCFNPQCVTGPTSTPICNSCSRTPYYLTHPICPSCAGSHPIPYHE